MYEWRGTAQDVMLLGGAIAGAGGIMFAARAVARKIRSGIARVRTTVGRVEHIYAELSPNGGSSVKDVVAKIARRLNILELRHQASLYETAYGVIYTDGDGALVWANPTFCRLVGRTVEELRGTGWVYAIAPSDRTRVTNDWEEAVRECRNFESAHSFIDMESRETACRVLAIRLPEELDATKAIGYFAKIVPLPVPRALSTKRKKAAAPRSRGAAKNS